MHTEHQPSLSYIRDTAGKLNFKQELTACFGYPVAENPTQAMVEAAYAHHQLPWRYLTIEVKPEYLPYAVAGARAMGLRGFNCTLPHKVAVIPHLDDLGPSAALMEAVNCVVIKDDKLIGENTDGKGFVESLKPVMDPANLEIVILGAGGAARAIGVELALAGVASITIINRSQERGKELVSLLNRKTGTPTRFMRLKDQIQLPPSTDIFINATNIGLYPRIEERVPIDLNTLLPHMIVADVIPNPPRTQLLKEAERMGCRTLDGLGMLVNQGVLGIQYWTGLKPDARVMRMALEQIFG